MSADDGSRLIIAECVVYGVAIVGMLFVGVYLELRRLSRRLREMEDENRKDRKQEREHMYALMKSDRDYLTARLDNAERLFAQRLGVTEKRVAALASRPQRTRLKTRARTRA